MDIDIDVKDRNEVLSKINHIRALSVDEKSSHNVGIYAQDIPYNPKTSTASLNYKDAEELGFFKIDILNNTIYNNVKDEEHLIKLMRDPPWELFEHEEIVEKLAHIHNYYNIVKEMKPKSVEQLAMVIAMIRPAKKHLVGKSWSIIEKEIWIEPNDGQYWFKKSHSIAYAMAIVVQLNLLIE